MSPYKGYKPFIEPFVTKIVEVSWRTEEDPNYITMALGIRRTMLSELASQLNADRAATGGLNNDAIGLAWGLAHPTRPLDFIRLTRIFYNPFFPWPWATNDGGATIIYPTSPPIEDDAFFKSFFVGGDSIVTGSPLLPGVSGLGAGLECAQGAGVFQGSQTQGAGFTPGIRGRSAGGGFSPRYPEDVPPPPSLAGVVEPWGAPSVTAELFYVLGSLDPLEDPLAEGPTLESFEINYSGLRIEVRHGEVGEEGHRPNTVYMGAAGAVEPKEYTLVRRQPPFTGEPIGLNGNGVFTFWLLAERRPDLSPLGGG